MTSCPFAFDSPQPQQVLAGQPTMSIFMTLTIKEGGESDAHDALTNISSLWRAVNFRNKETQLSVVTGIGSNAWDRLFTGPRPQKLHPFKPIKGAKHDAPATPGDIFFHLRGLREDMCFELAHKLVGLFNGQVDVVDEVHAFRYFDSRDLLGFVDGTANPTGTAAIKSVFTLSADRDFGAGSYLIVQKYLHDLDAWKKLTTEEQELIIGRSKIDNIEIEDPPRPTHVTLNTIVDEKGVEHDIVRDNLPFGRIGTKEFGTYFIGYAADPGVTEKMLGRMFVGAPPGTYDRILDYSTAETGCLFAVPPQDFLDDPPALPSKYGKADN